MIANQGGHLRRPIQPSRTGLSIQELKAMTAQRMNQSAEAVMSSFPPNGGTYNNMKTSQAPPPLYAPTANNNSRSRRQASRAAATMYADNSDFEFVTPQSHQPPAMTRVNRSTSPPHNPPPQTARIEKLPAHSLTVQELKELTRMRLAREAVGPSHSPSTDNDLDSEHIIHHRKNSGNSLLTFTTLESRGSGDRDFQNQGLRSGTMSPVSDSYTDDNDQFNYNGPTGSQHQSQSQHIAPPGQGIPSRKLSPALTYPPSHSNNNRNSNFPPQGLKNGLNGSAPGPHSSSQSMHAQATAQMAMLMDHQRRDIRDPYQSKDEQGNGDQASAMARLRIDQRALLQDRQNQQFRQQGLEDNQKPMQIRQQQLGDRRRVQNSLYNEDFDDYRSPPLSGRDNGGYDRGTVDDERSSSGQMSDR